MDIVINEDFKAYIDPLTPDEHAALERSLLAEGCRDALVLWGNVLVDGHNRYGICRQHGLPFQTVQNPRFQSAEDVHLWMIDQHLGRRSLSDYQRGVLALRKREIAAGRRSEAMAAASASAIAAAAADEPAGTPQLAGAQAAAEALPPPERLDTREALARAARLSSSQVQMVEKIQKQGAPELVAAVRAGTVSINAAAAVATLPALAQAEAAAGGAEALKQAAKQVREAKRKPAGAQAPLADAAASSAAGGDQATAAAHEDAATLRLHVAALEAENTRLRQQVQALQARLTAGQAGAAEAAEAEGLPPF